MSSFLAIGSPGHLLRCLRKLDPCLKILRHFLQLNSILDESSLRRDVYKNNKLEMNSSSYFHAFIGIEKLIFIRLLIHKRKRLRNTRQNMKCKFCGKCTRDFDKHLCGQKYTYKCIFKQMFINILLDEAPVNIEDFYGCCVRFVKKNKMFAYV